MGQSRMRNTLLYFSIIVVSLISCTKDKTPFVFGDFPKEIGEIVSTNCALSGCHNSQSYQAAASLNLTSWETLFNGSNSGSPVIPYSSKFSSLCYFVNTYQDLGNTNEPVMPLNRAPLSREQVKSIMAWIDLGAPDIKGNVKWADQPKRKKLYVVNQGCDVVTVIDAETQLPMRYIEVGTKPGVIESPHQVRVSPDGKYWYVVFINNNIMQKFSCDNDSYIGEIPLSPYAAGQSSNSDDDALDWNTFVISKDGTKGYCVSWTVNGKVAAVDLNKRVLLHYIPGILNSHGIALNAAEDKIYVTAQSGNYITEIDTAFSSKQELSLENGQPWSSTPSLDPHDILLSPDGQEMAITCQGNNQVRWFNLTSKTVTKFKTVGIYPQEIIYSAAVDKYFVSCTNDTISFPGSYGSIFSIDASTYATTPHKCGFQPHGIACDENKRLLYVLSRNVLSSGIPPHHSSACNGRNGYLNFIDLTTLKVLPQKYELSVDPYFISARP